MFESFNVPGLHISSQAALAILAFNTQTWKTNTGTVIDAGESVTRVVPVVCLLFDC